MANVFLFKNTPTLPAFIGVTNAHGPSPQSTASKSPTYTLSIITGSNQT